MRENNGRLWSRNRCRKERLRLSNVAVRFALSLGLIVWANLGWGQAPKPPAPTPAGRSAPPSEAAAPTSLPTDPSMSRRLDEARELINRGEIDRSLYLLQSLLDEENSSFLKVAEDRWEASREAAEGIILSADPRLLRRYRELHSNQANRILSDESGLPDSARWAEVTRRFFLTSAGRDGADQLGTWHLDHGNPELASMWFQRVLDSPAHVDSNLEMVRLKLAACQVMMGQPVNDASLPEQMVIAGQLTPTRTWIERMTAEWSTTRPDQEAGSTKIDLGSLPLLDPVWQVPLTEDATLAGILKEAVEGSASRKMPILFGYRPQRVGDNWVSARLTGRPFSRALTAASGRKSPLDPAFFPS